MLSIITTGRDDNYGEKFIERMVVSLKNTINLLDKHKIQFELLIIDWSPIDDRYLSNNILLSDIKNDNRVKFIVVNKECVEKRGLNPNNFYEYFAKNVGVRQSKYHWLMIKNPDILLSEELVSSISKIILNEENLNLNLFYRFNKRIKTNLQNALSGLWIKDKVYDLNVPRNLDNHVLGACSGDLLLVSKRIFCDYGKGYDESNTIYKSENLRQSTMDGEILINMHKNGASMHLIQDLYGHIEHGRPFARLCNSKYLESHYENIPNWGFWTTEQNIK